MTNVIETIIILLNLLLSCNTTNNTDCIKSQVSILGRVDPHSLKMDKGIFYVIKIDLINGTDTTLNFWTMSCSWQDNWFIEEKGLDFYVNCHKNTPVIRQLKPNSKMTYNGIVELIDTINIHADKRLRLGFVLIKQNEVYEDRDFFIVLYKKINEKKDIFWSEPFKIDK